ncbi:MAG: acylphosphatase [Patescibacteria group bacterium]|nr:acylphosphatase [Patescibacteria group bacterium]
MKKSITLLIFGKVQGVFFRIKSKQKAESLSLTGWVKNIPTGEVEIFAEGDEKNLKKLIDWCYNGIDNANVKKVDVKYGVYKAEFDKFVIML